MKAYVLINIQTGDIPSVVEHLKKIEGLEEATMTFGPYDAVAIVKGTDLKEIGRIVNRRIHPIPGILETLTCLAIDAE